MVPQADAVKVLDELPDARWRLLFSLARWGGLRVVGEPRALTWADVDLHRGRLLVRSSKAERYAGGESRTLPLFPELLAPLREVFEAAKPGEVYVLPELRHRVGGAVRNLLERAIRRAGLEQWPRLWHNLRASRQTEIENRFATHVVWAWLANNEATARRHYLQDTDAHYTAAARAPDGAPNLVRHPVRHDAAGGGRAGSNAMRKVIEGQGRALGVWQVTPTGFEPVLPG